MIKSDNGKVELDGNIQILVGETGSVVLAITDLLSAELGLSFEEALQSIISACYNGAREYHEKKHRP